MERYVLVTDFSAIKKILDEMESATKKMDLVNLELIHFKRMIKMLEKTNIVEWFGGENGAWSLSTTDKELSTIIEDAIKTKREIFNQEITEEVFNETIENIKNQLKETYICLKSEKSLLIREKEKELSKIDMKNNLEQVIQVNRSHEIKGEILNNKLKKDCEETEKEKENLHKMEKNKNRSSILNPEKVMKHGELKKWYDQNKLAKTNDSCRYNYIMEEIKDITEKMFTDLKEEYTHYKDSNSPIENHKRKIKSNLGDYIYRDEKQEGEIKKLRKIKKDCLKK